MPAVRTTESLANAGPEGLDTPHPSAGGSRGSTGR